MAKYLYAASYTSEGAKGLIQKGGTSRRARLASMIEAKGGRVEAF